MSEEEQELAVRINKIITDSDEYTAEELNAWLDSLAEHDCD